MTKYASFQDGFISKCESYGMTKIAAQELLGSFETNLEKQAFGEEILNWLKANPEALRAILGGIGGGGLGGAVGGWGGGLAGLLGGGALGYFMPQLLKAMGVGNEYTNTHPGDPEDMGPKPELGSVKPQPVPAPARNSGPSGSPGVSGLSGSAPAQAPAPQAAPVHKGSETEGGIQPIPPKSPIQPAAPGAVQKPPMQTPPALPPGIVSLRNGQKAVGPNATY